MSCRWIRVPLAAGASVAATLALVAIAQAPAATSNEVARGKELFDENCLPCHGKGGGRIGTAVLAERLGPDKSLLEERKDLTPAYVSSIVRVGINIMPGFRPTEITRSDLDAISAYLTRNNPR